MHIARYAIASGVPLVLLLAGALFGGVWAGLGLLWLTCVAASLDHLLTPPVGGEDPSPSADQLSVLLGAGHILLLLAAAWSFGLPDRSWAAHLLLFLGIASFLGQVSHPNAHELIHRTPRALRRLGLAVYSSMLFGHHVSAHRLVHHAHVGTEKDPNTPEMGESFWTYLPRAWIGSYRAGLAEERRRAKPGRLNPYILYAAYGAASLIFALLLGGMAGMIGILLLCAAAHIQILGSDYIQHYGLRRLNLPNGRVEPVAPHHSWNAPRWFTSFLMINAPSHSDHHMHPDIPYDALTIPDGAPILPYSMPIMAVIATMPRHWHRIMDKRAEKVMERARAALPAEET